jgi:multidrug efflux pump subunit AcrA (membrane-fusion protein)
MRFLTRSLTGLALFLATLGFLVAGGLLIRDAVAARIADAGPGRPAEERVVTARVITIEPGRMTPVLTAYGEVRAARSLELRSPAGGTIVWLAKGFEDGGAVAEGQVLLRLDPAEATTARDLAVSDLARVEAEAAEAGRALILARDELAAAEAQAALRAQSLARQRDLSSRGNGSDAAVETAALAASGADQAVLAQRQALSRAETQVALAATAVARQRITLAEAERALGDTELRAEFAGVLSGINLVQGGSLSAGEVLGQLIDPGVLEVSFRIPTAEYGQLVDAGGALRPLPVEAALDVGSGVLTATGHLARVGAAVGEGQTGRLIYAALDGSPAFRPGDFVTLRIEAPAVEGAALLPAAALGPDGSLLALDAEDRLEALPVILLRRQGDEVLIDAGRLAGREVVGERTPLLGAGIRVRAVRGAEDGGALVALSDERRAELTALVEADAGLAAADKARLLDQLAGETIPAAVLRDLEQRAGG